MTVRTDSARTGFRVIEGGREPGTPPTMSLQLPPPPEMGPAELAAEMAELYALSLVRDLPFSVMQDPHCRIWIDGTTHFTLHELLCELRSLTWFDEQALPVPGPVETVFSSRTVCGEADHRRGLRRNGDGQLTLRSLFRGVVGHNGEALRLSAFHHTDRDGEVELEPSEPPAPDAPMSRWLDWIERFSGAALALPGRGDEITPGLATPRELVARVQQSHPCRIYYNAVLRLLARGVKFDPGLQAAGEAAPVSAQNILSLMAETADRAFDAAMRAHGRTNRLSRPGVFAARLTALLQQEDPMAGEPSVLRGCAEELSGKAPNLLHWVDRMNRAFGRDAGRVPMLLVPPLKSSVPLHRADYAAQAVIAGALSTLLKALFDTRRHARLRMVGSDGSGVDIGTEADRLAADIALARSVAGGYFQAENYLDLRLGEALACHVLRERLEMLGQSAALGFTDFNGAPVSIAVNPSGQGQGHATFHRDGRHAPWPMEALRASTHLAVV
ncbi:bromoperoxidase [Salipiger abyssi]|nr:bromoperoxidase [Salipiger abyssi]